jgi:hypothetical protein
MYQAPSYGSSRGATSLASSAAFHRPRDANACAVAPGPKDPFIDRRDRDKVGEGRAHGHRQDDTQPGDQPALTRLVVRLQSGAPRRCGSPWIGRPLPSQPLPSRRDSSSIGGLARLSSAGCALPDSGSVIVRSPVMHGPSGGLAGLSTENSAAIVARRDQSRTNRWQQRDFSRFAKPRLDSRAERIKARPKIFVGVRVSIRGSVALMRRNQRSV